MSIEKPFVRPEYEDLGDLRIMPYEDLDEMRTIVEESIQRLSALGGWSLNEQLVPLQERIPKEQDSDHKVSGFDADIACALRLIPIDKQALAAQLHDRKNPGKNLVLQIRKEAKKLDGFYPSETTYWLAAQSMKKEGGVDSQQFLQQLKDFQSMRSPELKTAAKKMLDEMIHSFTLKDGVPYGEKDGCIQGALIAGYSYGTQYDKNLGLYYIGTCESSLGLEDFKWSDEKDEEGRPKSGPIGGPLYGGSRTLVKCSNEDEFLRALEVVKARLPLKLEEEKE